MFDYLLCITYRFGWEEKKGSFTWFPVNIYWTTETPVTKTMVQEKIEELKKDIYGPDVRIVNIIPLHKEYEGS